MLQILNSPHDLQKHLIIRLFFFFFLNTSNYQISPSSELQCWRGLGTYTRVLLLVVSAGPVCGSPLKGGSPPLCCSFSNHILSFGLLCFIPLCPTPLCHFLLLPAPSCAGGMRALPALPAGAAGPGALAAAGPASSPPARGKGLHRLGSHAGNQHRRAGLRSPATSPLL